MPTIQGIRITSSNKSAQQGTPNIVRAYRGKTLIASAVTGKARPYNVIRKTYHNNAPRQKFIDELLGAGVLPSVVDEIMKFE
jgi:hypothetical protein